MSQAKSAVDHGARIRLAALGALWALFAVTFAICRARTGGTFIYPLDDSYIHLALARTISEHGIYGVTPYEFTPTSSSIVWPLLLVGARLLSTSDLVPLLLNASLASALVLVVDRTLEREGYRGKGRLLGCAGILFAIPIVPLVFIGMEHTLHVVAVILLVQACVAALADDGNEEDETDKDDKGDKDKEERSPNRATATHVARVAIFASLAMGARYETLFVVAPLGVLALVRGRLGVAIALGLGAAVPLVGYAAFSVAKGGPVFPISVLLKRNDIGVAMWLPTLGRRLIENPHLLALLTLLSLDYVETRARGIGHRRRSMLLVAAGALVLHTLFAQTGWLFRYEAYVVALALVALSGSLIEHRSRPLRLLLPLALALLPVFVRGMGGLRAVPKASANIYEQQVQMARFLAQYYRGGRVVVQDIGAVSYWADVRIVDLIGLGSLDVATLQLKGALDGAAIERLTRDASIAIVDEGYTPPPHWRKVGLWRNSQNTVCRDDAVSLYVIHADEEARLTASLREFSPQLPAGIEQSGPYTR
ncbi:hypothetical protein [Pendulispora albinea]|uniref:Mannosyltransferase n=1 Tax=Pendulispora albinea TaxID=2741071 RepID=A0ABZ2M5Q4_9BACT